MNKKKLLEKLKTLYEEAREGFPSQQGCIEWANKVTPLLKFNEQYYVNFLANSQKMNYPLSSVTLLPAFRVMLSQVEMAIEELKLEGEQEFLGSRSRNTKDIYIDVTRIEQLENISKKKFDLVKLIEILKELNICYTNGCYLAVITLTRALIDHVPPIFNCKTFSEVANNYGGPKSFKDSMKHLENSSRKIADQHLHCQIRTSETLPNEIQINFSNDIDVLLAEIVRILKN